MTKRLKIIICLCVVSLIIIALIPKNVDEISNAVVNDNNGDIAFSYLDFSGRISMLRICLFSKDGEELFSKGIFSDGGSHARMLFYENNLCIYEGRTGKTYSFDRNGNVCDVNVSVEAIKSTGTFRGWKTSFGRKTYSLNGYLYCYESPHIFKHRAYITIKNDEQVKTVYSSS